MPAAVAAAVICRWKSLSLIGTKMELFKLCLRVGGSGEGHIIPYSQHPRVSIYWSDRAENAPTAVVLCCVLAFTLWAPQETAASLCGGNCGSRPKARGQRRVQQLGCGDNRLYFYLHFLFEAANEEQLVIGRLQVVFNLCHPILATVSLRLAANQLERSHVPKPSPKNEACEKRPTCNQRALNRKEHPAGNVSNGRGVEFLAN